MQEGPGPGPRFLAFTHAHSPPDTRVYTYIVQSSIWEVPTQVSLSHKHNTFFSFHEKQFLIDSVKQCPRVKLIDFTQIL